MKIFSIVSGWFARLMRAASGSGSTRLVDSLSDVERVFDKAMLAVQWVGDVVVSAISNSHLPVSDIIAIELRKMCPDLPDVEKVAGQLAVKDRPDMLLSLAVIVLRYMGARSVKLSILRAAVEVAHLVYSASKGK